MKNIKKILFFGLILIFSISCDDAINIVQDGEINDAATFTSVSSLRQFLEGDIYGRVDNTNEIDFTAVFTDEVGIGQGSGGQGLDLHRYIFNANDGDASSLWISQYGLINRVNRLIEASNLVTPSNEDPTESDEAKQTILAEARVLRAYAYLQLEAFFSTDMSDDNALGVMLLDFVPEIDVKLPRVANSQIYALMEADLDFAENNLSTDTSVSPNAFNYKYVTMPLVNAIRARMYVYRKNYTLAKQYAQAAITDSGLALSNTSTYDLMWNDLSRGETIFAASRPSAGTWGNIAGLFFFNTTSVTGGVFHDMGRNLYNSLAENASDVRFQKWIDATSLVNPNYLTDGDYIDSDVLVINKYPGKASQPLRNDLKLFRISEMKLILAECEVGGSVQNLVQAATLIQEIRSARNTGQVLPVYASAQEAWADILSERRKELCFEGHRYLDIKRLGGLANKSIDRNPTDDSTSATALTLPLSDHRFTFPIPQNEVAGNVSIQQNTGY